MKDIQNLADNRKINIQKVGVKNISYPIVLRDKAQSKQHTIASVNMYCNLPHQFKGTHMSRFIEILNDFHGDIDMNSFQLILERMKLKLEAEAAHLSIEFPFLSKKTRVAEQGGLFVMSALCMAHLKIRERCCLILKYR